MKSDKGDSARTNSRNNIESIQLFIDQNIRPVRTVIYIAGGITVLYIARSIHMTSVFTRVEDIPAQFIRKQVRLQGRVRNVRDDGMLCIQHIPIMKIPFTKKQDQETLLVQLACIDIGPEGKLWLNNNVLDRSVWFHLLHRSHINGVAQLHSKIEIQKKYGWNIRVNEELVKKGLCKISQLSAFSELDISANENMLLYLDKLVKLEHQASKKGLGMWTQSEEKSVSKRGLGVLKSVITSPFYAVKWVYNRLRKK